MKVKTVFWILFFQIVKSLCCEYVAVLQNRYPIAFISLTIPKSRVDVNIEPNKTNVLLENMVNIICSYIQSCQNTWDKLQNTLVFITCPTFTPLQCSLYKIPFNNIELGASGIRSFLLHFFWKHHEKMENLPVPQLLGS